MRLPALSLSGWVLNACLLVVLLLPLKGYTISLHPIHISVSEVRYDLASQKLQVAIKIFADDLELALKDFGYSELKIGASNESPLADEAIVKYLNQKFQVSLNGNIKQGDMLGRELSEDLIAVWCYLEYNVPPSGNLSIRNEVLIETYDDQKNIMDIKMNSSHRDSVICGQDNVLWRFTFKPS